MATRNLLIGKSRYTSNSDRERERLQAQITTYAIRHHSDLEIKQQSEFFKTQQSRLEKNEQTSRRLDSFIDHCIQLVEDCLAPTLPDYGHGWD